MFPGQRKKCRRARTDSRLTFRTTTRDFAAKRKTQLAQILNTLKSHSRCHVSVCFRFARCNYDLHSPRECVSVRRGPWTLISVTRVHRSWTCALKTAPANRTQNIIFVSKIFRASSIVPRFYIEQREQVSTAVFTHCLSSVELIIPMKRYVRTTASKLWREKNYCRSDTARSHYRNLQTLVKYWPEATAVNYRSYEK